MILTIIGALVVGGTLGLLGSGGSILTVPILVYLLGRSASVAVPESLAIVGSIALLAAIPHAKAGRVHWPAFWAFSAGGALGAYTGALLAELVPDALQLIVFAGVMGIASWRMLSPSPADPSPTPRARWLVLGATGLGVGVLTGFVGVGGGFLIVPALAIMARLPMQQAVATSLSLIPVSAAFGLAGHLPIEGLDGALVGIFVVAGFLGSQVGSRAGARLPQATLRRVFAVALIPVALFILSREALELLR